MKLCWPKQNLFFPFHHKAKIALMHYYQGKGNNSQLNTFWFFFVLFLFFPYRMHGETSFYSFWGSNQQSLKRVHPFSFLWAIHKELTVCICTAQIAIELVNDRHCAPKICSDPKDTVCCVFSWVKTAQIIRERFGINFLREKREEILKIGFLQ